MNAARSKALDLINSRENVYGLEGIEYLAPCLVVLGTGTSSDSVFDRLLMREEHWRHGRCISHRATWRRCRIDAATVQSPSCGHGKVVE